MIPDRKGFVNASKQILEDHQAELETIENFAGTDSGINSIGLDGSRVHIAYFSREKLTGERKNTTVSFQIGMHPGIKSIGTGEADSLKRIIGIMDELGIDLLIFYEGHIEIGLKSFNNLDKPFLVKGEYNAKDLRSREEMIKLFNDKHSRYWIYPLKNGWMAISNP
jgi:hypothetical protein